MTQLRTETTTKITPALADTNLDPNAGRLHILARVFITAFFSITILEQIWVDAHFGKFKIISQNSLETIAFTIVVGLIVWLFLSWWRPLAENPITSFSQMKLSSKFYFIFKVCVAIFLIAIGTHTALDTSSANYTIFYSMLMLCMTLFFTVIIWYAFDWLLFAAIMALSIFNLSN